MKSRCAVLAMLVSLTAFGCGTESAEPLPPAPIVDTTLQIPQDPEAPEPLPGTGWTAQNSNAATTLTSITAVDPMNAWTTGWTAGMRRTDNGGSTWMPMAPSDGIKQIQFIDGQHGWAISSYTALATSDGGMTWTTRKSATQNPFTSLSFLTPDEGWITAANYEAFKTTDGGETWTSVPVAPPPNGALRALRCVRFVDSEIGWMLTSHHEGGEAVLKTTDGGATWEEKAIVGGTWTVLNDLATVGPDRAWVVGAMSDYNYGEIILATTDGGTTWTQQYSDGSSAMTGVHFVDQNVGWAVGKKIHHTTNGGTTWTIQPTVEQNFSDVYFIDESVGWVVGANGVILKTETGGQ